MKNMENLSNMKKTVLKLEKEISAISLNLTKVQKKDHSTMKRIINNINNLLTEECKQNNIYSTKINNYLYDEKEKKNKIENENNNSNNKFHSNNKNKKIIDYITISLKQPKRRNKVELNLDDETFFKTKDDITSKNNIRDKYNLTIYEKSIKRNNIIINNDNKNNLTIKQNRNKSRNNNNLLFEQMTYSKPKLNNNFSKRNLISGKHRTNSSNLIKNNIFDTNNNINIQNQYIGKNNLSYNKKINSESRKINNYATPLNEIYLTNKINKENKAFNKNLLYDKNIFQIQKNLQNFQEKLNNEYSKENEEFKEYKQFSENNFFKAKSKGIISDIKLEKNKDIYLNINSKNATPLGHYYMNTYRNNIHNENNKKIKNPYLIIDKEKSDTSFKGVEEKNNNEDYFKKNNKYKNKILNMKQINYNLDKYDNISEDENIKLKKLLNILNANDISEAISCVAKLMKFKKYINKFKEYYDEENQNNNCINNSIESNGKNKDFTWFYYMVKNYKENQLYKNFCESIMMKNNIKKFEDFKKYINNILINNRKNNGFLVEVRNILCEDDYHINEKKWKSVNKTKKERPIKKIKRNNNKISNNFENSNDIKFSRNDENLESTDDFIKTNY